jgi:hypothetical protein
VTVLNTIGRTRLIPLQHIVPEESARILLKLEYENPTGSMKDRMALAMVEAAEADGRLRPGGSVVEYTGGSTGVSLAFVCAVKRVRSLGQYHAPVRSDPAGFSFVGVVFDSSIVAEVRITSGQRALGAGVQDLSDGGNLDLAVMDDYLYAEPQEIR